MATKAGNRGKSRIPVPANGGANRSMRRYNPPKSNGQARIPLLPLGVNNKATMPRASQSYTYSAEEVVSIINVQSGSTVGQLIYNQRITPKSALRLGILSGAWQRIDWRKASLHLVALNGSTVQSGYTMGWLEDPEVAIPTAPSDIIPFLTALRSTSVRQNWVESETGMMVNAPDKPEMYTQLGSDIRRYSPGRLVIAVAGDVDTAATFQLMLKYTVRLYVPLAIAATTTPCTVTGYTGSVPAADNFSVSTANITYPGVGAALLPGAVAVTTQPIVGILGNTTNASPPANHRLFPIGTSIQIGPLTNGSVATFITGGVTFAFASLEDTGGQFRAFTPRVVTTTADSHKAMTYVTSP